VIVPTFNELQNLPLITKRLFDAAPRVHLLVVDDGSPDGTGALADRMSEEDDRVHVMHRTGKLGLGTAYLQGFAWGLERGYDFLVEMDADGSHPPERLPQMIAAAQRAGGDTLVIGSRWVPGGAVENWPKRREVLSRGGNLYVRLAVGIRTKDGTAGFRVFPAGLLRQITTRPVDARGYYFQVAMTVRALDAGYRVAELPITFREREFGESKMSGSIILEAMTKVGLLGLRRRISALRRQPVPSA
jgi:dolichol-phosphate mannosyltransferase